MRILARYSHLNGEEYLLVHRRKLWDEVQAVIAAVDALACRTKVSRERTMRGRMLFSPGDMNQSSRTAFTARGESRPFGHFGEIDMTAHLFYTGGHGNGHDT